MALFIDDKKLAQKIVLNAADRLDKQMNDEGLFPKELVRTISLHYSTFVVNAFFTIAQMSEETGFDFWNHVTPSGKSLKKGFNELKPYLMQEKKWEGPQIKEFEWEDGYPLLMEGAARYGCKNCAQGVKNLAGDKEPRLRINLLY